MKYQVDFILEMSTCPLNHGESETLIQTHLADDSSECVSPRVKQLDPQGVEQRRVRRLRRRHYRSKGLNVLWHMDGYDLLSHSVQSVVALTVLVATLCGC